MATKKEKTDNKPKTGKKVKMSREDSKNIEGGGIFGPLIDASWDKVKELDQEAAAKIAKNFDNLNKTRYQMEPDIEFKTK